MSRAERRCADLRRIHALRELSMRLAESEALEARRACDDAQEVHARETARLEEMLGEWESSLAARRFDPSQVTAHAVTVNRQVQRVTTCAGALAAREAQFAAAHAGYSRALAEEACAGALLHKAQVRKARLAEERRLSERDDESARQRWSA